VANKLKLIFKGKILEDNKSISDYKIENADVLLYMIVDQAPVENDDAGNESVASQEIRESLDNSDQTRGFNRFRQLGMSQQELHIYRMLFHAVYAAQHRNEPINESPEAYLQREEDWINSQNNQHPFGQRAILLRNIYNSRNQALRNSQQSQEDVNIRVRTNNAAALEGILNRRGRINVEENESTFRFFFGCLVGFILTFYAILILLFFELKPKFKKGLQIGMIIGCIFYLSSYNN